MSVPRSPTPVKTEPTVSDRWKFIHSIYKWENVSLDDATACAIDRTCLACVKEMTTNPLHVCADSTTNTNAASCIHCLQNSAPCETITGDHQDAVCRFVTICHDLRSDRAKTEGALEPEALATLIRDYESQRGEISQLLESISPDMRIDRAESQIPATAQPSPTPDSNELTEMVGSIKVKVRMLRKRTKTLKAMIKGLDTTVTNIQTNQKLTLERLEQLERIEEVYGLVLARSAQISAQISAQSAQIAEQSTRIAEQSAQLRDQSVQLTDQSAQLTDQSTRIAEQSAQLRDQSVQLTDQSAQLRDQSAQIAALLSTGSTGRRSVSVQPTCASPMVTRPSIEPPIEPSAPACVSPVVTQPSIEPSAPACASPSPVVTQPAIEPSAPAAHPGDNDMEDMQCDNHADSEPHEDSKQVGKPDLILKKIIPRIHEDIAKMVPNGLLQAQLFENLKLVVKHEYLEGVGNLDHPSNINYENIRLKRGAFLYAFERWCKMSRPQRNQFYDWYSAASNNRERRYVVAYFQSDAIFSDGTRIHILPNTGPPKIEDTRFSFPANWYFHDMYHLPEHPALKSYGPEDIARNTRYNDSSHLDRQIIGVMHNSERYEEALAKFRKFRSMGAARQKQFKEIFWQGTPAERFILLEGLIYNIDMAKTAGWKALATKEHEARFAMCYPRHPHVPGVDVNPRASIPMLPLLPYRGQKRSYDEVGRGDE